MKEAIDLSINPSYKCNFRCSFCYLTEEQLGERRILELEVLRQKLKETSMKRPIRHVDVYGGEVALLDDSYLRNLLTLVEDYASKGINIITNLSVLHPLFASDKYNLSVSWDGPLRQDSHKVLSHILSLERPVHILMLASPPMLKWGVSEIQRMIELFNSVSNITSLEIKPYSSNQANQWHAPYRTYEKFVARWIDLAPFRFEFINQKYIDQSLAGARNAWSDNHLYITPEGKWAVLDFDSESREYFLEIKNWRDYLDWCEREKKRVQNDPLCGKCCYLGHCLSEHLRGGTSARLRDDSCDGFKGLLDWYAAKDVE